MTVAALTQTRVQISGDGVTDRVDVTFQFVDETDLKVIHTDNEGIDTEWVFQESPGNWYFSGGEYTSGTIHFSASDLATGERLTVLLTSQYDQVLSLDGGEIDPSVLERGMDSAALQIQAIAGDVSRSFRIAPSAEGDLPDLEVPDLPDGHTFVREGEVLVPAVLDSNEIGVQVAAAQTARAAAETAQTAAETAETNAETAESNAGTAASAASSSATAASTSATAASGSATAAANSATAAASSAASAATAKTAAETAETNAETAESNASSSASSASGSASSASSSATAASGSASSASSSASSASSSATSAGSSATAAAASATAAAASETAAAASAAEAAASASGSAANISVTPTGNVASTNVQAAIAELDSEKAPASAATTATSALNKANANETKIGSVAVLEHQRSTGTNGGTPTAGVWSNKNINTEVSDPEGIVSLSGNNFTVSVACKCFGEAYIHRAGRYKCRIYCVTDGTVPAQGLSGYNRTTEGNADWSTVFAMLEAGKTYRLQYYVESAYSTYGLGRAVSASTEVYDRVTLEAI